MSTFKKDAFPTGPDWGREVATDVNDIRRKSGRLVLLCLGGFAAWAFLFPMGSAVIGHGTISAEGSNKLIQHRTGGVITEIFARNGDVVHKGDVLFKLDPVIDQAELGQLQARKSVLQAVRQRLLSEQAADPFTASVQDTGLRGSDGQTFTLAQNGDEPFNPAPTVIDTQRIAFETGRAALQSEVNELIASRNALASRLEGLEAQRATTEGELSLIRKQVRAVEALVSGGHVAKKTLWDLQQQEMSLDARAASLKSEAQAARDEADGLDARVVRLQNTDAQSNAKQLTDTLGELAQIEEKLSAAASIVASSEIRSPVDGIVVHNKFTTVGGVLPAGEALAEIVPNGADLALKARVSPTDVAHVAKGQIARAKISSVNHRLFDDITGVVDYVAADASSDKITGQQYFEVNVKLEGIKTGEVRIPAITPGMQGEVFIEGPSRTFASYALQPFTDSLSRAFQEK